MLEQQGYTPDTVLPKGSQTFLRGILISQLEATPLTWTDQMGESYKQLAADMATAMGAWACGVDLIIPDYTKPASKELPKLHLYRTQLQSCHVPARLYLRRARTTYHTENFTEVVWRDMRIRSEIF